MTRIAGLRWLAVALAGLCLAEAASAQQALPKDSLELGRKYTNWFITLNADSLAARMSPALLADLDGRDGVLDRMTQVATRGGSFVKVVQEQFVWRGGARQYWQSVQMSGMTEPVVFRFVMDPSGMISGLGINPLSNTPPTDSVGPVIKP